MPAPLARLAEVTKLKLFVTTTFDGLAERALDEARFAGQRQTLAFVYAPNDKQDLPPEFDRLTRPAVFYLMGRLSATPRSYAVTRDDMLEFTESLQSRAEDAPGFLFDKLAKSDLLFIGTRVADWLAHLFARSPRAARRVDAAAKGGEHRGAPVVFVEHATGLARGWPDGSAADFARELHARWTKLEASDADPAAAPAREGASHLSRLVGLPPGAVILSCAAVDRERTDEIREALDRAGVDVLVDSDDVEIGEKWEMKLRHSVRECSLFIPVFSEASAGATPRRRWAKSEWVEALLEAQRAEGAAALWPLALDDGAFDASVLPERLRGGASPVERVTSPPPSSDFVKRVVDRQRDFRRASYA